MDIANLISIVFFGYYLFIILMLIYEDREPADTTFWLIILYAFPVLGIIIYLLFGRDWRKPNKKRRKFSEKYFKERNKVLPEFFKSYKKYGDEFKQKYENTWIGSIVSLTENVNLMPPLPANSLEIMPSGEIKFAKLLEDIASAKESIHMQYFIWEHDELTEKITKALRKKLKEGVEVKIMYDWLGCLLFNKSELNDLKKKGAKVISDIREIGMLNFRNHRKIVIIDGTIGYTGGLNMGQEYIDGGEKYPSWRDTHLRITGPFVAELQDLFAARWLDRTNESLYNPTYFPKMTLDKPDDPLMLQLSFSSANYPWDATKRAYVKMILDAKKSILLQSPYFIPDQPLYEALATAALNGVDVKIMITGWPDHKTAWWAAQTFFEKLLRAGAKVYYYEEGFFHAKTLSIDDEIASIGTTNFDIRSFALHNENTVFIYERDKITEHQKIFAQDLQKCREFTIEDYNKIGPLKRLRNSLTKLLSNLY